MTLEQRLLQDIKAAMKSGDKQRVETLRFVRSQLKNVQIEKRRELTDDEVVQVLSSAAKKHRESIKQFTDAGRDDRAGAERQELAIIESYLPEQMNAEAITRLVEEVIQKVHAQSSKDMGKVMAEVMPAVKGKADGQLVQQIVRQKLASL